MSQFDRIEKSLVQTYSNHISNKNSTQENIFVYTDTKYMKKKEIDVYMFQPKNFFRGLQHCNN